MLVVKDAMVLIHLARLTLLERACDYFGTVAIPERVFDETVVAGREHDYSDAEIIAESIDAEGIEVVAVDADGCFERAKQFNLHAGEAAAVALYWQRDADLLASDDDNVRSKRTLLDLALVSTPAILLDLYEADYIGAEKLRRALAGLREIGWFSDAVIDKIKLEAEIQ